MYKNSNIVIQTQQVHNNQLNSLYSKSLSTINIPIPQQYPINTLHQHPALYIQQQQKLSAYQSIQNQLVLLKNQDSNKQLQEYINKPVDTPKLTALRFVNEKSGVGNLQNGSKVQKWKDVITPSNLSDTYSSVSNSTIKPVKPQENISSASATNFARTFPVTQIQPVQTQLRQPAVQHLILKPKIKNDVPKYLYQHDANYSRSPPQEKIDTPNKSQLNSPSIVSMQLKAQTKHITTIKSSHFLPLFARKKQASPIKTFNMVSIIPPSTSIIEENPFQEDRGDIEQLQGQGMELDQQIIIFILTRMEDILSFDRSRKKSITLFEMHFDNIQSDGQFRHDTHNDDNEAETEDEEKLLSKNKIITRLNEQSSETLQKAKLLKVLVNGVFDEREFYVDIGQIPQEWRIKQFAHILNKMYSEQQGYELKTPIISILIGKVHTKRLDQTMKMFELIDLAVSGIMGQDNMVILEELIE